MPIRTHLPLPVSLAGLSDAELLLAWVREKRQREFTELVRRHLNFVQGVASRKVGPDSAQDVAQQVFAALAKRADRLTGYHSISGWLYKVALFECKAMMRKQLRSLKRDRIAGQALIPDEKSDAWEAWLPHLDDSLEALPERDREVILLRFSEGLGFDQISARTGRREAALRKQVERALEKLQAMLKRRGVTAPTASLGIGLGVHLKGAGTAAAAERIVAASLSIQASLTSGQMLLLTFLTMTTKQSILTGGVLAALFMSVPIVEKRHEVRAAGEKPAGSRAHAAPVSASNAGNGLPAARSSLRRTSISPEQQAKTLEEFGELIVAEIQTGIARWQEHDAWIQARKMAQVLNLTPQQEESLRRMIVNQYRKRQFDPNSPEGMALREKAIEETQAWYEDHLNPGQTAKYTAMQERNRAREIHDAAMKAVENTGKHAILTDEQTAELTRRAVAKAEEQWTPPIARPMNVSFSVGFGIPSLPLEQREEAVVNAILTPEQSDLWRASRQRDSELQTHFPERVLSRTVTLLQQIPPEEIEKAMNEAATDTD